MTYAQAEYIWMDGNKPTQELRSKTRIIFSEGKASLELSDFPSWSFDGSSTQQATGEDSDCLLEPVNVVPDPIRGPGNYLVLCEVMNPDGTPHKTNSRAMLRKVMESGGNDEEPWVGFEQEYTLFQKGRPLNWPHQGYPEPQGPYYCGVGGDRVCGRDLVEAHTKACIEAGIMIYGVNAEVMQAQWEFQLGYRGNDGESADPLNISDHLWLARWLLNRQGEDFGYEVSLAPKPIKGDWNGAGKHTNFSTRSMRDKATGREAIKRAVDRLGEKHHEHISVYGAGLSDRLTGEHETCDIKEFRSGTADRGASIRIPIQVDRDGHGYIEDRRPAANADPYVVSAAIVQTACGIEAVSLDQFRNNPLAKIELAMSA